MSTPALSQPLAPAPLARPPSAPARGESPSARAGPAAHGRTLRAAWPSRRPAPPARNPAWEILAGVLLVVGWALLWGYFLTGVVEPGAELHRDAGRRAALTRLWTDP